MHVKTFSNKTFAALLLAALLAALANAAPSHAALRTVIGTVSKVSDGDTIGVTTPEHTKLKVRLYGIDAPETPRIGVHSDQRGKAGQHYASESMEALAGKIRGRQVKLEVLDIDKYRRLVCMVWLNDRNINLEMVREGHAEAFVEYLKPPYRAQFLETELEARGARLGIWSLPDYERPRDFRKRLKTGGGE